MRPISTSSGTVVCAAVAGTIGVSVLVGWALGVGILLTWVPGYVTLKANTAVCLVAGALALLAQHRPTYASRFGKLASACAAVLVVVAGLTLGEYAFGWELGIDQLLAREMAPGSGTSHPGRMAPNTALAFVLMGVALHAARGNSERSWRIAQACTFTVLFLAMVALVGYLYQAHVLVGLFSLTRMALHTILGMFALGVGTLCLTASGGWMAELTTRGSGLVVARRLLPAALLIPVTVGIATLSGYRAGLYDPAFGAAVMAVVETVSFTGLVWLCTRFLNESERGRNLAARDDLTGLLNRRGFLLQGEQRRTSARRLGEDALLLFIDLDGMKAINDTFGHAAGDRALVETAQVLCVTFRDGDVVARLGGDEFAVLAVRATLESAPWMLSRLDAQLARLNAETPREFTLELSTGITACLAAEDHSITELLDRADARMYEQKQAARSSRPRNLAVIGVDR